MNLDEMYPNLTYWALVPVQKGSAKLRVIPVVVKSIEEITTPEANAEFYQKIKVPITPGQKTLHPLPYTIIWFEGDNIPDFIGHFTRVAGTVERSPKAQLRWFFDNEADVLAEAKKINEPEAKPAHAGV